MYLRARLVLFAVAVTPCLFCPINQPENGNKPLRGIQDEENRVKRVLESQETLSPDHLNANPCKNVVKGKYTGCLKKNARLCLTGHRGSQKWTIDKSKVSFEKFRKFPF